ncbi:MAG: helical backbone metal receptor [Candidatus Thermoplasmatota archaeon]
MRTPVKKGLAIFCIVLIALGAFLAGYYLKKEKIIKEELPTVPSILLVTYPPDDLKVSESLESITVKGMTFGESVEVNENKVPILNGTFTATVALKPGTNTIRVKAVKGARVDETGITVTRLSYPITVYDDLGRKTTVKERPQGIVSIAPSCTEILFALGLGDKVVGVTTYCDYPPEATTKEKVGGYATVNIEKVVSLQPDLVLATGGLQKKFVENLATLNITTIALYPHTLDEVLQNIRLVGLVTNTSHYAEILVQNLETRIYNITSKTSVLTDDKKVSIYYEMWCGPYYTAGPGTFVNDLIIKSGGMNIGGTATTEWPTLTEEFIITSNPQVIITTKMNDPVGGTPEAIKNRTGWNVIEAVKHDRVYLVDGNLFERPGPRLVDGLELLAKLLHPGLFT